jgi:hypothetical protein
LAEEFNSRQNPKARQSGYKKGKKVHRLNKVFYSSSSSIKKTSYKHFTNCLYIHYLSQLCYFPTTHNIFIKMQFKAALLVAAAGLASADILSDLALVPSCVLNCYAVTAVVLGCDPSDVACVCGQEDDLLSFGEPCVEQYCSDEDILSTYS